ncbi:MAG: c-type cytochrome [Planctomycetota bacterium]|nr:c-type cytochrome [Planctomycetota bacterium]
MSRLTSVTLLGALLVMGCAPAPQSGRGFTLPNGDVKRGQAVFVELQCHACHQVDGVKLEVAEDATDMAVRLGGKVNRIQTYGELVTSIINPSHKVAKGYVKEEVTKDDEGKESRMRNYNEVMTVQQLIDLVKFLQSHYELKPYEPTDYPNLHVAN